jgi:molybdenum cofactor biosynthesis protein B
MNNVPQSFKSLKISVLIVSDTRTESSDKSGRILEERIKNSGHSLVSKLFVKDEPALIKKEVSKILNERCSHVIITSGGTGITGRDSTPEVLKSMITKEIPGFGEIFRYISFKKIGTSSLQSRAVAGLINTTFIFALPGSPSACKDAWDEIIKFQLDSRTKPCNLVELMPRLEE